MLSSDIMAVNKNRFVCAYLCIYFCLHPVTILYFCTNINTNDMKEIEDFLRTHPLISIRGLEKECNMPLGTIRFGRKRTIPEKYYPILLKVLRPYGALNAFILDEINKQLTDVMAFISNNK